MLLVTSSLSFSFFKIVLKRNSLNNPLLLPPLPQQADEAQSQQAERRRLGDCLQVEAGALTIMVGPDGVVGIGDISGIVPVSPQIGGAAIGISPDGVVSVGYHTVAIGIAE